MCVLLQNLSLSIVLCGQWYFLYVPMFFLFHNHHIEYLAQMWYTLTFPVTTHEYSHIQQVKEITSWIIFTLLLKSYHQKQTAKRSFFFFLCMIKHICGFRYAFFHGFISDWYKLKWRERHFIGSKDISEEDANWVHESWYRHINGQK